MWIGGVVAMAGVWIGGVVAMAGGAGGVRREDEADFPHEERRLRGATTLEASQGQILSQSPTDAT